MPSTIDKSGDRVRRMFGQIAGRYDLLNHVLSLGIDIRWRAFAVRKAPPQGTDPILDVCTGTGDLALAYWKAGEGKVAVIGTDFTPEMLEIARQKWERISKRMSRAEAPVTFEEADTQHLPFDSDTFQIVSVAFGLRNVADTRAGLKEMVRVCKPGGQVAILEFSKPQGSVFGALYRAYFKYILPRVGQSLARNEQQAYHYLPATVAEFPCGQALADVMIDCGLGDVQFTPLTFGVATLYIGTKTQGGDASSGSFMGQQSPVASGNAQDRLHPADASNGDGPVRDDVAGQ